MWLESEVGVVAQGLDGFEELGALGFAPRLAIGHHEIFEAGEFAIKARVFNRWRE